ncbi:MAG: glycosyltransferase, partial [Muribaculaceae bacterium]|nr:glycosyltransferase [Muribaculaceae bacterium]
HAKGDLIGFIDSDDWIEPEMYQVLHDLIVEYDADIAQVGYIAEYQGRHSTKHLINKKEAIGGNESMMEIGFDRVPNYVWNKLQKKSIISCDFPEGRNFEDIFVYGQWLKNVKKMALDPTPLYHYRLRKGSIIHTDAAKNRYDYYLSCIDRMQMIENSLHGKKDLNRKFAYINKSAVNAAKMIARMEKDKIRRDKAIKKISNDVRKYPLPTPRYIKLKPWWRAKILRSHPVFFSCLMRGVHLFDLDSKHRDAHLYE